MESITDKLIYVTTTHIYKSYVRLGEGEKWSSNPDISPKRSKNHQNSLTLLMDAHSKK